MCCGSPCRTCPAKWESQRAAWKKALLPLDPLKGRPILLGKIACCGPPFRESEGNLAKKPYDPQKVSAELRNLYADPYVKNRRGIFEYILGGSTDTKLLDVRVFDDATKKSVYAVQTQESVNKGVSNCPLCALGQDANKNRLWKLVEMDADHVAAWSRGGATDIKNCQMLCKTHNRAKGNR